MNLLSERVVQFQVQLMRRLYNIFASQLGKTRHVYPEVSSSKNLHYTSNNLPDAVRETFCNLKRVIKLVIGYKDPVKSDITSFLSFKNTNCRETVGKSIPRCSVIRLVEQNQQLRNSMRSVLPGKQVKATNMKLIYVIVPVISGTMYKKKSISASHSHVSFVYQKKLLSKINQPILQQLRFIRTVMVKEEEVVSSEEITRFLLEQNMKHEQGFTCFITKCPRLGQTKKTPVALNSNQMYINMTTGHFLCEHCCKRGGWRELQDNVLLLSSLTQKRRKEFECFKDVESVQKADRPSRQALDLWEGAMPIKTCATDLLAQIQEHFDIKELQASTLEKFGVRFDIKSNSLVLPAFDGTNHLMGARRRTCTIPEENDNLRVVQDSLLPRSGVLGLFGFNMLTSDVQDVVLTSCEVDAMAVWQETGAAALAFPAGFSALPQELLPSLERFSKLILWFGDDVRAWEAAKLFAKKLNEKRCFIIRPSVEDPSPFTALRQGLKLKTILSKARPIVHKAIVSFAQLRQEVFSELAHVEQVAGVKWKRYVALNRLLKGHRRGELTIFTGPTGSGKTTFMSDYSLDLCMQGVSTLWGSFEINNVRLGKMMLTQFAQCNLSRHLADFDQWADQFENLSMYFMTFFGQESIRKVIEAMSHAVYVHDIAHVVVDNLQFMMGTDGEWGERFAKQDAFISAFRKFATNMNCHVTLVVHPRKEKDSEDLTTASVFGSAKATQEADNVLILQDKRLSSVRGRKYLQITKNRFDGELGVMLLKFDKESLSFAVREKLTKRLSKEESGQEESHLEELNVDEPSMEENAAFPFPSTELDSPPEEY